MSAPPYSLSPADVLLLRGADRLAFAQRLGSGDLRGLQPGEVRHTLFCSKDGKLVAWCRVWAHPEALVLELLGAPQAPGAAHLKAYFEPYIIMDDVAACLPNQPLTALWLEGFADDLPQRDILQPDLFAMPAARCALLDEAAAATWRQRLQQAGGHLLTAAQRHHRRIAAGIPDPRREGQQPLELHLQHPKLAAIAWNKGCYVGQEVISRLENYRKVARQVLGVAAAAPLPEAVAPGDWRVADAAGQPLGRLTSWSEGIGLALVKRQARADQAVLLRAADHQLPATLQSRPFFVETVS